MNSTKVSLGDCLWARAARHPERPAIVRSDLSLTYAEFAAQAARTAHALKARGLGAGDRIGVASRDGVETMIAMFATWFLDAVSVPIDFRMRADEKIRLAQEFDLSAIIEDRDHGGTSYMSVVLDADWHESRMRMPATPLPIDGPPVPALISLTSGTTGRPLGIELDHHSVIARFFGYSQEGTYVLDGIFLNAVPVSSSGSRNHSIARLLAGGTLHFFPPIFGADEYVEALNSTGASFTFAVPTTVSAMLDLTEDGAAPLLPNLKTLYVGGASMTAREKQRAQQLVSPTFMFCFSSSITGTCSVLYGEDVQTNPDSSGRILPLIRAEVVDADGNQMPAGETGILRVRSPAMSHRFYQNRSRDTGDRIMNGWAYTGDFASITKDRLLTITGRTSDMIIRGGTNVYPAEVETVIAALEGVRDCAVVGYASDREGQEIAAFIETDRPLDEAQVIAYCRAQLVPDKRPRRVVLVDELPRNANGKVLKRDLVARLERENA